MAKIRTEAAPLIEAARLERVMQKARTQRDPRQHDDWPNLTDEQQAEALDVYHQSRSRYVERHPAANVAPVVERDRNRARSQAERGNLTRLSAADLALFTDAELVELVKVNAAAQEERARRKEGIEQAAAIRDMVKQIKRERAEALEAEIETEARQRLGL